MLSVDPAYVSTASADARVAKRPPIWGHLAVIVVALTVWAASVPFTDLTRLDDYGLLPSLPITVPLAVSALCVGFALAVRREGRSAERLAVLYLVALVIAIYATIPLLYSEPRYAYVYKHIAVIHYIEAHGAVDRNVDIYQNWPGFFALNAMLSQVSGIDAVRYANWTQLLFPLADLLAVRFVFSGLSSDRRRIHIALLVFLLGSWVEYTYLAPQSLSFFLTLVCLGVALRWLRPDPTQWHHRLLTAVARRARSLAPQRHALSRLAEKTVPLEALPESSERMPVALAVLLVLAMSFAVVTSHQLTPFFLVLALSLLVVWRRCRTWWLPIAVTAMALAWIALSYKYLAAHYPTLVGGSPVNNLQTSNHPVPGAGSSASRLIADVARVLSVLIGFAALAGAWRDFRGGRRPWLVLALAGTPVLLLGVQSYGGEGIYRIYMFMMPWLAFLAAGVFADRRPIATRWQTNLLASGTTIAALLFLTTYYGQEHENHIPTQEVAATEWFDVHTPPGSALMMMIQNDPYPIGAHYDQHLAQFGHYAGEVLTDQAWARRRLGSADISRLHAYVIAGGPNTYLLLSPSQIVYAENHGYAPHGSLAPFFKRVESSKMFKIVFRNKNAYVLRPVEPSDPRPR